MFIELSDDDNDDDDHVLLTISAMRYYAVSNIALIIYLIETLSYLSILDLLPPFISV